MLPSAEIQQGSPLTSPARLAKIDQLRDKNFGAYLPLPQLVAVGDQSSGKSSLLESLTGIPFPHGQELCTRYATQITHRREAIAFINVSIIPGPSATAEEKTRLEGYHKTVATSLELQDQLPCILEQVNQLMGIRSAQNPEGTKTFTEDVLKIEKCGPKEDYLTVIDVPGIFRITTDNVTTETDKTMVRNMVQNYIRDDQTIILAVLPCNVDIVTQEILAMAEQYDTTGQRTLGILTKPDLVREKSAQAVVCNLVKGEKRALNLGYHIVRSRGADDDDLVFGDAERDVLFQEEPWCRLPPDRLGVVALRRRLQHLLGDITDKAFPKLRAETRQMLSDARVELAKLGQSRQTVREQQQYLVSIASEFQSIVRSALNADYSSCAVFDDDKFRLITNVLNVTDEFKAEFTVAAHKYEFDAEQLSGSDKLSSSSTDASFCRDVEDRMYKHPDLDAVIVRSCEAVAPMKGIMEWIRDMHRRFRGRELASFNQALFSGTVRQQTSNWETLTEYYVSRVIYMIHEFIVNTLEIACSDTKVCDEILSQMLDAIVQRYSAGMEQSRLLVEIERDNQPYTLNDAFRGKLGNFQNSRMGQTADGKQSITSPALYGDKSNVDEPKPSFDDSMGGKYIAEEVHDLLMSYYEVARDRFIDNVYLQAITHCLMSGFESPLRLFSEQWVLELEPEKLEAIAGESFQLREQRDRLTKRIKDLNEAVAILR